MLEFSSTVLSTLCPYNWQILVTRCATLSQGYLLFDDFKNSLDVLGRRDDLLLLHQHGYRTLVYTVLRRVAAVALRPVQRALVLHTTRPECR